MKEKETQFKLILNKKLMTQKTGKSRLQLASCIAGFKHLNHPILALFLFLELSFFLLNKVQIYSLNHKKKKKQDSYRKYGKWKGFGIETTQCIPSIFLTPQNLRGPQHISSQCVLYMLRNHDKQHCVNQNWNCHRRKAIYLFWDITQNQVLFSEEYWSEELKVIMGRSIFLYFAFKTKWSQRGQAYHTNQVVR